MSPNHWSNEQLMDHVHGMGPGDAHLESCLECKARFDAMHSARRRIESAFDPADALSYEWLAAQRRAIYRRIEAEARRSWWAMARPGWASAALAIALLSGGWAIHEKARMADTIRAKVSDSELADQVSQIATDTEPEPAAPLEALFEN